MEEAFFRPQRLRVWEMAEAFLGMGCAMVVIKCGANGQAVLDGTSGKRWDVPAYPVQPSDVTGAGDAYCGGFLAGLVQTGDPLEAALRRRFLILGHRRNWRPVALRRFPPAGRPATPPPAVGKA
jgi:hypothetical protein